MERIDRISSEMMRVIADIIRSEVKDPRIPLLTSVMDVKVTKDLKFAKVFVSVFGTDDEKKSALEALKNSAGFIRRQIGQKMIIRSIPQLNFVLDESIERGAYMSQRIDEIIAEDKKKASKNND